MLKIKNIGDFGEKTVKKYLIKNNINIIKCNFFSKFGEIDIIASDETYILFIEVKTYKSSNIISALERVDIQKQNKILKTAQTYLLKFPCDKQIRFDVIEVDLSKKILNDVIINHIKNAF